MSLVNQGESSGGPSSQSAKRRRGRPRKDSILNNILAAGVAPVSEGATGNLPQGAECAVGQAVTGVIEASFDSGYLLNVRIGNSNTTLKGVVFKTGHYIPVTAENDVAPHAQFVRRNNVHFNVDNLAVQTSGLVPPKRKYAPRKTARSVVPVGEGSFVGPVGAEASEDGDKEVHMVEPLTMILPPDQPNSSHQVALQEVNHGLVNEGAEVGQEENPKAMVDTSGMKVDGVEEAVKSSVEDSGIVSKQEIGNLGEQFSAESPLTASVAVPMSEYENGRMTEILQVVQENTTGTGALAEETTPATEVDSIDAMIEDAGPENEASVP